MKTTKANATIEIQPGDTGDDLRDAIYANDLEGYSVSIVDSTLVFVDE